jgi:hypothetical protein
MRRAEDRYGEGVCRVFGTLSVVNGACPDSTCRVVVIPVARRLR